MPTEPRPGGGPPAPGQFAEFPGAYLNTASVALTHLGAAQAVQDWFDEVAMKGTVAFGDRQEARAMIPARRAAARLFGVDVGDIAVGSSYTELLSSLAWALAPDGRANIVSTAAEFPSTVYPWARVAEQTGAEIRLAPADDGWVDDEAIAELIDSRTVAVSVADVEYRTGQVHDLAGLAETTHDHGAALVVDASQSAGARPVTPGAIDADAVITCAYKWLCGPFGAAVMYLHPRWHHLRPGLIGFRSHEDLWDLDADRFRLPDDASRFEYATLAYGAVAGMGVAIEALADIGIDRIHEWDMGLAHTLEAGLGELDLAPLRPAVAPLAAPIVSVRVPAEVPVAMAEAGVIGSERGGVVRFSPHLYNTADDIAEALAVMGRALTVAPTR